jgi:cytochrome P450
MYPEPSTFSPERFLGDVPQPDPRQFAFGYGRRMCPGQQLAEGSVFLTVSRALATLDIRKQVGADGKELVPEINYQGTIVVHPRDFPTSVKPRSSKAEALVRAAAEASL